MTCLTLFGKRTRDASPTKVVLSSHEKDCAIDFVMNPNYYSRSPPPLQHPVPTHPAFIPEPPSTPISPQGYQRFASSPPNQQFPSQYHAPFLHHSRSPPTMQSQSQSQPQPHLQQQIPDFTAWGMNDTTAQFGMHLGHSAVAAGQDYVQKNVRLSPVLFLYVAHQTTVRRHDSCHHAQAPLQCVKFLRYTQTPARHIPLAT